MEIATAFEQATRLKLRFNTAKGALTVEDLWDLPLTSGTGKPNLDTIAVGLYTELREAGEAISFVTPNETASAKKTLQAKFDIVKHIIDVRVAENKAEADARKNREFKQRVLEIIAEKKDDSLKGKSLEELQALAATL